MVMHNRTELWGKNKTAYLSFLGSTSCPLIAYADLTLFTGFLFCFFLAEIMFSHKKFN